MTAQRKLPPMMTVADFIEWPGDGTDTRYELVDGELRAMAPGADSHNTIVANLIGELWRHSARPDCLAASSALPACSRACGRTGISASPMWV